MRTHQVVEFAERGLGGYVVAGNDAGVLQGPSGGVKVHVDVAAEALCDVEQYLAGSAGLSDYVNEPGL